MKITTALLIPLSLIVAFPQVAASKGVSNYAYVQSGLDGRFYARCVPAAARGEGGTTTIYRVNARGDQIVDRYSWYTRAGLWLGWSPIAGKVAVMRRGGASSKDLSKQVELRFYLGGTLLASYSSRDLVALGARIAFSKRTWTKRAEIQPLGVQQIPLSNHYSFIVKLGKTKLVAFDILNGKPRSKKTR